MVRPKRAATTRFNLWSGFVVLPLCIAVLLYCLFRVNLPSLLKWVWHQPALKLDSSFDWLVYNLPDGLWAFALMSFLVLVCRDDSTAARRSYYAVGMGLMVVLEMFQGSLIPGTFDPMDLLAMFFGTCTSLLLLGRHLSRVDKHLNSFDDF